MESTEKNTEAVNPVEPIAPIPPRKKSPIAVTIAVSAFTSFVLMMGGMLWFINNLPEEDQLSWRNPSQVGKEEKLPEEESPDYEDFTMRDLASVYYAFCGEDGGESLVSQWPKDYTVFQCPDSSVYFVRNPYRMSNGNVSIGAYPLGKDYDALVEKYFPGGIYFFCNSCGDEYGLSSYLKIMVEADSAEDVIARYAEALYFFLYEYGRNEMQVTLYYNETSEGIDTTEQKLLLHDILQMPYTEKPLRLWTPYTEPTTYVVRPVDSDDVQKALKIGHFDEHPKAIENAVLVNKHYEMYMHNFMSMPVELFHSRFGDMLR